MMNKEKNFASAVIYVHNAENRIENFLNMIIKTMEDILFEPLESGKPNHEGRGMGLYIVKKILNSFNANIELLSERNSYGNRYKFLISMVDEEG